METTKELDSLYSELEKARGVADKIFFPSKKEKEKFLVYFKKHKEMLKNKKGDKI